MRFNKIKQTYLIGGVAIVLLALLSWFFLVSPRLAQASEIGEHRVAVEALNAKSAKEITALTTLKDGLVQERKVAAALAVKFPPTADQATLFRQIVDAAARAKIPESSITSLGPAAPILGTPSGGAKLPGAAAAPAAGDAAGTAAAPAKATSAKSAENMATMAVSFNAQGDFNQMVAMLTNLENLPRSFLITQVNLSTADKGKFTIAVQGNMYVHRAIPDPEAKAATSTVAKAAYCAPLALADAYEEKNPMGKSSPQSMKKLNELLRPALTAASTAGRTDVGELLSLLVNASASNSMTAQQQVTIGTTMAKVAPVILKDCGIKM